MLHRMLSLALVALALVLFAGSAALADQTHEGIVVKAADGKLTMTDKDGKNQQSHEVAANAQITLDGKECKLADLKEGFKVKVTCKEDAQRQATKIEAKSK